MDGKHELLEQLQLWAAGNNVRCSWHDAGRGHGYIFRVETHEGDGKAVMHFPEGFWEKFESLEQSSRDQVMHSLIIAMQLQFDPTWNGQLAKTIPVYMSLVDR